MKFVLFTTSLAGGGAEKAMTKIAHGLVARGHDLHFVVCDDSGAYTPPRGCSFHVLGHRLGHGWLGKRRLAWRLGRLLKSMKHDLLVSTLPFADEIAALAEAPHHVCRVANTLSAELARLSPDKARRRAARYRWLYGSRPVVAVSHGVAADLHAHFGTTTESLVTIANPFDLHEIRTLAQAPCPDQPTSPYILHVGRFAAQKRHDLLFAAFARMVAAGLPHTLVLLTTPDDRLAQLAAQHGIERRLVIADFQANPYPWMAGADALVLCSDHEGLPNVLIEGLACGTRVVSTDCPSGPREILTGELAQWLVPCGDVGALADTLARALAAPKPDAENVAASLASFRAEAALDAWEALAQRSF